MAEKISFAIENADVLDENPNSSFAVMSVDFFASGLNLHDMIVSEETLHNKAETIKNCPLVWIYDSNLDDIGTHDKQESPCGFVPESAEIKSRVLPDGRVMLSTVAYVWKKYTGKLLDIFKRDSLSKPVSVEMSVFDMKKLPNGLLELLDYKFEAITILGSFVTPAIPLAKTTILSFSREYKELVKKEFSKDIYSDIDFTIPEKIKSTAKKALKEYKSGKVNSVTLAVARHIINNDFVSPDKIKYINKYVKNKKGFQKDSNEELLFMLMGGKESVEWSNLICNKMEEIDNQTFRYFEAENNKETMESEKMPIEEEVITEQVVEQTFAEEDKETPAEEKAETPAEEKKEKEEGTERKFSFPEKFNLETMSALFSDDEDEEVKMAKEELGKGDSADFSVIMSGMFARMCKMSEQLSQMSKDKDVYMSENEELKKFKAEVDEKEKMFAVESTLKELSEKVVIPNDAREEMLLESQKYSLENIDAWKTFCKAKSFDFAVNKEGSKEPEFTKIGLVISNPIKTKDDLWSNF